MTLVYCITLLVLGTYSLSRSSTAIDNGRDTVVWAVVVPAFGCIAVAVGIVGTLIITGYWLTA